MLILIMNPERPVLRKKSVLEEIYLVDAKTWRDPLVISPEVLALEHKCSTEIIFAEKNDEDEAALDLTLPFANFRVTAFNDKSPNKPVMKIEASFLHFFFL